jgi:hypothetical protein
LTLPDHPWSFLILHVHCASLLCPSPPSSSLMFLAVSSWSPLIIPDVSLLYLPDHPWSPLLLLILHDVSWSSLITPDIPWLSLIILDHTWSFLFSLMCPGPHWLFTMLPDPSWSFLMLSWSSLILSIFHGSWLFLIHL